MDDIVEDPIRVPYLNNSLIEINPSRKHENERNRLPAVFNMPSQHTNDHVLKPYIHNDQQIDDDAPLDDNVEYYITRGCGIVSIMTENLLMHPFLVLRRQCQVNPISKKYHVFPVTLLPIIIRLNQTQGICTLWKGIGSVLIVRGLSMAIEDLISKVTYLPKEISGASNKMFFQHIILKCVAIGMVTPFYSASLIETVQSDVASEKPGILDVFRDGMKRLLEVRNKGRLIPILALQPPTIACGVLKYLFSLLVKSIAGHIIRINHKYSQKSRGAYSRVYIATTKADNIEFQSILISLWTAEIVFYPLETIIQRLHLQGTRTIIDDLDTGRSVTAMLTDYSGVVHCYQTIISTEGVLGLYKGFGALIIQFAIHTLVLKVSKWIFTEIGTMMKSEQTSSKSHNKLY
ncbi:PREDICTED: solute carrier family 25 member 46-like [Ceratosolen solmsi marchali]|uniref:Solute carrier family 25 member 46-like n=1 Tax=Ceratosolen solmsi marchali TaxID=326594 RepID=A0AAJ6YLI6_9HYME|nr:PREDICTED: solute carrier family 25 member 46-like [Ceratosolen solmsi marchali]